MTEQQQQGLLGANGLNINLGVDAQSVLYIVLGVFVAVVLASVVSHLIIKNI